jgi:hypothetical protein
VKDSISSLEFLKTAQLDVCLPSILTCSYRLDAWQTSLFAKRLERLNALREGSGETNPDKRGVHLGAYGWLENVRPAPAPVQVSNDEIPETLREDASSWLNSQTMAATSTSFNQSRVAAAVLRNAYLTHANQNNADHFAVN